MKNYKIWMPLILVILALTLAGFIKVSGQTRATSRTFPETNKTVQGKFLTYWDTHGALPQQGFPISEEMQEKSDTNGKVYTVQYFERAVFELHTENQPPNDVLLSLLGVFLYKQKYGTGGAPGQVANTTTGSVLFPQTGKRLGGIFLDYWKNNGALPQQGYPISDEFMEKSDLDGKTYRVQYFERAVFEYHPENKPPYNVLLSQLGTFRYNQKYKVPPGQPTQVPAIVTASPTVSNGPKPVPTDVPTIEAVPSPVPTPGLLDAGHFTNYQSRITNQLSTVRNP